MNDADYHGIVTYIIKTKSDEYYCGKTLNFEKRKEQHKKENHPHWFSRNLDRKIFVGYVVIEGDHEEFIKRAGVKKSYYCINNLLLRGSAS